MFWDGLKIHFGCAIDKSQIFENIFHKFSGICPPMCAEGNDLQIPNGECLEQQSQKY